MPPIVLLPSWALEPTWKEIIGNAIPFDPLKRTLQDVKPDWLPRIEDASNLSQVEAFAFPTPFAWAEMTAAVIQQGNFDHVLFRHYEDLVLGLALGHLKLDVVDLKGLSLGTVLADADERFRYFGLLRGRGSDGHSDLDGKVFGGTSPETLFWPSPRRSDADWLALREAISLSNQDDAYHLLLDFRILLQGEKLWNPDQVVWMKALTQILGGRKGRDGSGHYQIHSRSVGPIVACLPDGELKRVYFPVYEKDFAANFLRGLTGTLHRETDRVGVFDRYGRCFDILLPIASPDGDLMKAGAATVNVLKEPARDQTAAQIQLQKEDRSGLFDHLQDARRKLEGDLQQIKRQPFFYPDAFRVPVSRLGEAGINTEVSFSTQAYQLTFDPNSPGLPLASELKDITQETYGVEFEYEDASGQRRKAIYIDIYKGTSVGDLRAIGWVLWTYFTGGEDYVVQNGKLLNESRTLVFKEANAVRPFDFFDEDVAEEIYKKIKDGSNKPKRLATQQRFVKAYKTLADKERVFLNLLCLNAAQAFTKWVWPEYSETAFLPNGPLRVNGDTIKQGNLSVVLLKDQ